MTLAAPNKQEVRKMLQGMLAQDRVSETHVMVGMMRMVGLPVDVVMYNLLMTAYKKRRQWQHVLQVMQQMQASGVMPDIVSYNILIDACGKAQQLQRAFEYYDEMVRLDSNGQREIPLVQAGQREASGAALWATI